MGEGDEVNKTDTVDRPYILVVDDDEAIHEFLGMFFEGKYNLLHAYNGVEGVEKWKKFHPKLILMDYKMQPKDGLEASLEIKQEADKNQIPVTIYMITATPNFEKVPPIKEIIQKPIPIKTLRDITKEELEQLR